LDLYSDHSCWYVMQRETKKLSGTFLKEKIIEAVRGIADGGAVSQHAQHADEGSVDELRFDFNMRIETIDYGFWFQKSNYISPFNPESTDEIAGMIILLHPETMALWGEPKGESQGDKNSEKTAMWERNVAPSFDALRAVLDQYYVSTMKYLGTFNHRGALEHGALYLNTYHQGTQKSVHILMEYLVTDFEQQSLNSVTAWYGTNHNDFERRLRTYFVLAQVFFTRSQLDAPQAVHALEFVSLELLKNVMSKGPKPSEAFGDDERLGNDCQAFVHLGFRALTGNPEFRIDASFKSEYELLEDDDDDDDE